MVTLARALYLALVMIVLAPAAGVAEPSRPVKVAVVALALWSDQGVFRSEATRAAALLAARYGAAHVVVRGNTRARFAAGPAGMEAAMRQAGRGLDPARDVLMVVMTSHGSPEGIAEKGGNTEGLLAPDTLASLLRRSPVRRKVLIVSACYSGIFAPLASPDLLVITAADASHPSFGCEAGATWTYFGRAFFDQALREGMASRMPLPQVFAHAAALVRARELKEGFEPSNPTIGGGADVETALDGPP